MPPRLQHSDHGCTAGSTKEIATFQASDVATGPTAMAIAERVVQLMRTRDALESERRKAEATLAPVAPGVPEPTVASPTPMRMLSRVPDVTAELVEFTSFENTITVEVRFTNSSEEGKHLRPTAGTYVLDEASHNKYSAYEHSNAGMVEVPAGGSLSVWAKYGLPGGERPQHLTVALPNGVLFEHLEIR